MTQAWNLSQLANKVNTSGQLDVSTGVSGTLPIANGGTNNASLGVTAGGVVYTDGSKQMNTGAGTSGQVLLSGGAGAPTWGTVSGYAGSTIEIITSTTTWTPPSGITKVNIFIFGGGGGGANGYGAGKPGSGGSAWVQLTGLSGSYTLTIGAGGAGGAPGSAGGTTSFGSLVSATGGAGQTNGTNFANGTVTVSSGTTLRNFVLPAANGVTPSNSWLNVAYSANSQRPAGSGTTGVAWSVTADYIPGAGGSPSTSGQHSGGAGGAIIIQY